MNHVLIHPNWHVIFLHAPLGLLTIGVLIELFGFLWRRSTVRTAGRWMIFLGALAAIPSVTTGLYALADVGGGERWTAQMWQFIRWHMWLMVGATGAFVAASVIWAASSERWRVTLYWPILIVLVLALVAAAIGAWFSGEAVYRYGVAVQTDQPSASTATAGHEHEAEHAQAAWRRYVDPFQTHLLLVGLTIATAVGAMTLTIRRWTQAAEMEAAGLPPDAELRPPAPEVISPAQVPSVSSPAPVTLAPLFPARFWLLAAILALLTGLAGLITVEGLDWRLPEMRTLFEKATSPDGRAALSKEQNWMLIHFIIAINIIVLPLILAALTRFARRAWRTTAVFILLVLAAVGLQIWAGVTLLFHLH